MEMRENRKLEAELLEMELGDQDQELESGMPTKHEKAQFEEWKKVWKLKQDLSAAKNFLREKKLERLPSEWFDDPDICSFALTYTNNYQGLSHDMKCDIRIIKRAFLIYGAQQYLNLNIPWESIPAKAQNDPEVVVAALKEAYCLPRTRTWEAIPTAMQNNPMVAWHVVRKGIRTLEELPFLLETRESVLLGLDQGCISWEDLPDVYRSDVDLARSVSLERAMNSLARGMLEHLPILRDDRAFWLRFAQQTRRSLSWDIFETYATQGIRSDADVVLSLVENAKQLDEKIPRSMWDDAAFVARLNKSEGWWVPTHFLLALPQEKQTEYFHLVVENIEAHTKAFLQSYDMLRKLAARISPELWSDRRLVEAWFKSSLPFVKPFHDALSNDKEVFLWIAEHCRWTDSFNKIGPTLLEDKDYLAQVLQHSPQRYSELPQHIQKDCCLALLFYGNATEYQVKSFIDKISGDEAMTKFVGELQIKWKTQLDDSSDEAIGASKPSSANSDFGVPEQQLLLEALANMKKYEEEKKGESDSA